MCLHHVRKGYRKYIAAHGAIVIADYTQISSLHAYREKMSSCARKGDYWHFLCILFIDNNLNIDGKLKVICSNLFYHFYKEEKLWSLEVDKWLYRYFKERHLCVWYLKRDSLTCLAKHNYLTFPWVLASCKQKKSFIMFSYFLNKNIWIVNTRVA